MYLQHGMEFPLYLPHGQLFLKFLQCGNQPLNWPLI